MEITGITHSIPFMFRFPGGEDSGSTPPVAHNTPDAPDMVTLSGISVLDEDEEQSLYTDTLNMIASDNVAALSVHSGLVPERVFALLGM
ncbi:MAG: hypothetical protein LBR31_06160 [Desulfovibrio sp.]|jgi:hypothetical protein|nr:hypothetical protein [Desulfovibrio sp.]